MSGVRRTRQIWLQALLLALALALVDGAAHAADEGQVLLLRAEQLAAADRCEDALAALDTARAQGAPEARVVRLEGECAMRLHRYQEAIPALEEARRLDPDDANLTLTLGMARYHMGDVDGAALELDEAVRRLPDSGEAHLYRGLVLLERAEAEQAALELERAAELDPRTDPAASYYAGHAWNSARDSARAEAALNRVLDVSPGTAWADQAELALDGSRGRYQRRSYWGRVLAGFEYDSNVVLRGAGVVLPTEISDEADWRGVWFIDGGTELLRNADWAVGTRLGYYGNAHGELRDFDTQFPTVSFWADRSLGEDTYLRFQPDFGFAWVGYDPYLLMNGVNLNLHHAWEKAGWSRPLFRWERRDYKFDDGDPVLDRDGNEFTGGYDHEIVLSSSETLLRGGVAGSYYDSDGSEFEHAGVGVRLLGRQALPWKFVFDLRFRYVHEWYQNASVFAFPASEKRRDDVFFVAASVERPIWQRLKFQARYRYENDLSNVDVYKYDRHVVGGYFIYDFGSI